MSGHKFLLSVSVAAGVLASSAAQAQTDITWWHGMGGRNGEVINEMCPHESRRTGN